MHHLINYFKRRTEESTPTRKETKPSKLSPPQNPVAATSHWYIKRPSKIETQELHKHIDLAG